MVLNVFGSKNRSHELEHFAFLLVSLLGLSVDGATPSSVLQV